MKSSIDTVTKETKALPGWHAKWIWGAGEESPRNEWRCFRKRFTAPATIDERLTKLRITADSRYILYVNGQQVGRGPVRSWPFELAYDEYEIGHMLHAGSDNVIAVLVLHYGVSTFQYLRGRGGLLVQVESGEDGELLLATDDSWKSALHAGHNPDSSRISCQLAFTEIMDARAWDDSWVELTFEDSSWESVTVIGPAGTAPWVNLVKRDIPYLTEEPIYPVRVESLSAVKPVPWTAVLDLLSHFAPDSANHANNILFNGYIATLIRVEKQTAFTIGVVDHGRISIVCSVNGKWFDHEEFTGEVPEQYLRVNLDQGDNFLLLKVTGSSHGHGFHIGFDSDEPFEVLNPLMENRNAESSSFVGIGPFDTVELIDHQENRMLRHDHPDIELAQKLASADQLAELEDWVKPVSSRLVNLSDVFAAHVWQKEVRPEPVPYQLQNAVIAGANAAVVPEFAGMDTEFVIDFGRELSGYISFEVDASAGTIIDFYGFEYMRDGWRQHTYLLDNTLRYICKEGRQTYTSYVRRGLRYLTLTVRGAASAVNLYEVQLKQSNYPVADIGRFHSSDSLLNDIWQISSNTTRMCMEDTFVDCPAFEQAYWVGDARNEALVNYYVFGAKEIVERCLKLVPGSSFQTPYYVDQVPSGWNSVIPNWTFFWVTACYEYYGFSGDASFASTMWPHVRHTLEAYLQKINDQGLLYMKGWNLLDWAPFEQPRDGIVTPQNMFLVKALRDAAKLAEAAGDKEFPDRYRQCADELRGAIDQHLWDDNRQAYVDCIHADGRLSATTSMQTQVTACLCGIPQGDRAQLLESYVLKPPESFVQIGSPFMSFFNYEALAKIGRLDVLLEDMRAQYGVMIEHEATTCWEMYPSSDFMVNRKMLTRSHCHAWSAGPAYFLGAYVLGVRGVTPGWSKVTVAPEPIDLAWARGAVPLPSGGRIDVSWRVNKESRRMSLRLQAPRILEIEVIAPDGYELDWERIDIG